MGKRVSRVSDAITDVQRRANDLGQGIDADDVSRVIHCFRDWLVGLSDFDQVEFHRFMADFLDHDCDE